LFSITMRHIAVAESSAALKRMSSNNNDSTKQEL
jgi:hypothetical protein